MNSLIEKFKNKLPPIAWGMLGCIISGIGIIITIITYVGRQNEPYSVLNHFISELGDYSINDLAVLFNIALISTGICLIIFISATKELFNSRLFRLARIFGYWMSFGGGAVGIFSMNIRAVHRVAAISFFLGALLWVSCFSLAVFFDSSKVLGKKWALFGVCVISIFVVFFIMMSNDQARLIMFGSLSGENRPIYIPFALMEWIVYWTLIVWIFGISFKCFQIKKKNGN
jgi:hypothetical protein